MHPSDDPGIKRRAVQKAMLDLAGRASDDHGPGALGALLDTEGRYSHYSAVFGELVLDYSRQHLDEDILRRLFKLADAASLTEWRDRLFSGDVVNNTENRPALHMALRGDKNSKFSINGEAVMPAVLAERRKMFALADQIRSGSFCGATGKAITDVVNIGIGGSDLGLVMVTEALKNFSGDSVHCHFVSNIDGVQLADLLAGLDPETTLFVICSKSFVTLETQLNANSARDWVCSQLPRGAEAHHFVAISVNDDAMDRFGIAPQYRFRIWDWVGGRYSLWSSIGLVVAIAIGPQHFESMLSGAAGLDEHFLTASPEVNLPILMGLIAIWNQNFMGVSSHAVLPYDQRLHRFPAFLQQLDMESNGKRVDRSGQPVDASTGVVIWGEPGSNAQHSFLQLLHQGTSRASIDFLAPVEASSRYQDQHRHGLSNMLAQAEALARGVTEPEIAAKLRASGMSEPEIRRLAPHKVHPGNCPSNILLFRRLDPASLGALIALYEHRVFVQATIWGINPFDQWGVELGKVMASGFYDNLKGKAREREPGIVRQIQVWDNIE